MPFGPARIAETSSPPPFEIQLQSPTTRSTSARLLACSGRRFSRWPGCGRYRTGSGACASRERAYSPAFARRNHAFAHQRRCNFRIHQLPRFVSCRFCNRAEQVCAAKRYPYAANLLLKTLPFARDYRRGVRILPDSIGGVSERCGTAASHS